ncbi:hypothetical protein ACHHYP_07000 [Achlya hypogyna]|uniref:Ankyrin repeat protein n=1 Tax=Achlya hypogyna TaxID=1202772 RepID=A0A1V9YRE4_ACHHY|nr:hypothetical protein ACHHYP_07000 [Achlya hypogyna]
MVGFTHSVLGQPPIAAIVFSFQFGLYEDVRDRFRAFHRLIKFTTSKNEQGQHCSKYLLLPGFDTPLLRKTRSVVNCIYPSEPKIYAYAIGLRLDGTKDERFPLHLAICENDLSTTQRILRCQPDLAYSEAIEVAFRCGHFHLARYLWHQRAAVPELHRHHNAIFEYSRQWVYEWDGLHDTVQTFDSIEGLELLWSYAKERFLDQRAVVPELHRHPNVFFEYARQWLHWNRRDDDITTFDSVEGPELLWRYTKERWLANPNVLRNAIRAHQFNAATFLLDHFPHTMYPKALDDAAECGGLALVKKLHHAGAPCSTNAMDNASSEGHLHVVRFLHEHRTEGCSKNALSGPAWKGHLDVVEFLHGHRPECRTASAMIWAMKNAASYGHLDVVRFLHDSRTDDLSVDNNSIDCAAGSGHLDVVRYFHELGVYPFTTRAVDCAAMDGHIPVVRFLHEHRTEGGSRDTVVRDALRYSEPEMAHYLVSLGYPATLDGLDLDPAFHWHGLERGVPIVQFLLTHNVPLSVEWMDLACKYGRLEIVQLFHEHSTAGCTTAAMDMAAENKHWDIVRFLLENRTEGCTINGLLHVIKHSQLDILQELWDRYPDHFNQDCIDAAVVASNLTVLQFFVDVKFVDPKATVMEILFHDDHVGALQLLLRHCKTPSDPIRNLGFLVNACEALHERNPGSLLAEEMIAEIKRQAPRIPWPNVDIGTNDVCQRLLDQDDIQTWALTTLFLHYWTLDAASHAKQLYAWGESISLSNSEVGSLLLVLFRSKLPDFHNNTSWSTEKWTCPNEWELLDDTIASGWDA